MNTKIVPFSLNFVKEVVKTYPTPFVVYDKKAILENLKDFYSAFSWVSDFKNFFAVKACPNPTILKLLKQYNN
jgi:diaminopimelate decarboxylase